MGYFHQISLNLWRLTNINGKADKYGGWMGAWKKYKEATVASDFTIPKALVQKFAVRTIEGGNNDSFGID